VICRVTEFAQVLQSRGKDGIEMAVFLFLCSWLEAWAIALHPLQLDSPFCFSRLGF
jgi:hypothetical protein